MKDIDLTGETLLAVGYGSGDAAEAIPLQVVPGWRDAAERIGFSRALGTCVDLTQNQYEALHDGREVTDLDYQPSGEFVVARVGQEVAAEFQDIGIEYYEFVPLRVRLAKSA